MRTVETRWRASGRAWRRARAVALVAVGAALAACSSTATLERYRAPELAAEDLRFQQLAALAITENETHRRDAENALVEEIRVPVVQAHTILPLAQLRDPERARPALDELGIDGVVVVRLLSADTEVHWIPGNPAAPYAMAPFWGYYGVAWADLYDPGYARAVQHVRIETRLYSYPEGRLLWGLVSETLDPRDVDALVHAVVTRAAKELRAERLID
jgi:hypothetical protein